jgi:hypothetical protein
MQDLQRLLEILEAGPASPDEVFNPWRDTDERDGTPRARTPARRRANFEAYVDARRLSARVMLMGEAPSHRGCRFSGIPFCSEVELTRKGELVARRPLALTSRDAASKPQRERSAAVIWDEIDRAGCAYEIVLWNAFPWHPYPAGNVTANRKPRTPEVAEGRAALRALLECFTHRLDIFAVGKVAQDAIARWPEVENAGYIRHPSMGGEARFREGFRTLVASRL